MSSLRRIGVIVAHELRLARRDPTPVMVLVLFPLVTMAFLEPAFRPALVEAGHVGATGAEQVVPGQATMSAFFIVSLVTFAFFAEYGWGTWDRLRVSRATSIEIVVGKTIPRFTMVLAQFVLVFAFGFAVFDLEIRGDSLALVPLVVAFSCCLVMLGVAITAICHSAQQAQAWAIIGMVLFGAIGGALVPFDVLPNWARTIAPVTPTYWAMRGFRSVILAGDGLEAVAAPIAVLLAMTAGAIVLAMLRFRFDQHKAGWI
jgi:ABC-2 type transport system permease protein